VNDLAECWLSFLTAHHRQMSESEFRAAVTMAPSPTEDYGFFRPLDIMKTEFLKVLADEAKATDDVRGEEREWKHSGNRRLPLLPLILIIQMLVLMLVLVLVIVIRLVVADTRGLSRS
jgi:hypothetical protein